MPADNSTREWRPIPDWEGVYEVSSHGEVRRIIGPTGKPCCRLLKPCPSGHVGMKYYHVLLRHKPRKWFVPVHKLVLLAFDGPRPTKAHETRHLNGDRFDNRITNLRWGTHAENEADRVAHGNTAFGERSNFAKLREWEVLQIIASRQTEGLAGKYGVTEETIRLIRLRRIWRYLG